MRVPITSALCKIVSVSSEPYVITGKIEKHLLYMLDVYLGEDGWSKRAGEAAKNMELLAKIDLFILQRLKAKLGKSIPRVQMLLTKLTPMQLFDLEL